MSVFRFILSVAFFARKKMLSNQYEDSLPKEDDFSIKSKEIMAEGLSTLGRSPRTNQHVYTTLNLPVKNEYGNLLQKIISNMQKRNLYAY